VDTLAVRGGVVYVGGRFWKMNGVQRGRHLAPLNATTGRLKRGYRSAVDYRVLDILVTRTTIFAAADGPGGHLRALDLDGSSRWNVTADGAVQALTLLGGVLYAGGHFDHVCVSAATGPNGQCLAASAPRWKFAAVAAADGTLTDWAPQANSPLGTVAMDRDPRRGLVGAGGEWTTFAGSSTTQQGFAQFSQVAAGS
jgi:outer membrane protein assembly factor BamB